MLAVPPSSIKGFNSTLGKSTHSIQQSVLFTISQFQVKPLLLFLTRTCTSNCPNSKEKRYVAFCSFISLPTQLYVSKTVLSPLRFSNLILNNALGLFSTSFPLISKLCIQPFSKSTTVLIFLSDNFNIMHSIPYISIIFLTF